MANPMVWGLVAMGLNFAYLAIICLTKKLELRGVLPLFFVISSALYSIIETAKGNFEIGIIGLEYIIYFVVLVVGAAIYLAKRKPLSFKDKYNLYVITPFIIIFTVEAVFIDNLIFMVILSGFFAFIPSLLLARYFSKKQSEEKAELKP